MTEGLSSLGLNLRYHADGNSQLVGKVRVSFADLADDGEPEAFENRKQSEIPDAPCDDPCRYRTRCKTKRQACEQFEQYVLTGKWTGSDYERVPLRETYRHVFEGKPTGKPLGWRKAAVEVRP